MKSYCQDSLVHLSHSLRISYCHLSMSIVYCQKFALNDIFPETTRLRALIFGMKHCLTNLYQLYSNSGPGVQNGLRRGSWIRKSNILKDLLLGIWYIRLFSGPLPSLFKYVVAPSSKMAPHQGVLGLNDRHA